MSNKIRICIHCEKEYNILYKKFGKINECNSCGENGSDANTERIGAVMQFDHKTGGYPVLMSLKDAKEINRRTDRRGGQGIIVGLAEKR